MRLSTLASKNNPWEEIDFIEALRSEKSEGRFLEWKLHHPFESDCTKKTKFRIVKALVSFANTDGGFVICGVDPSGKWIGASSDPIDAAQIQELVSGCISPEISVINFLDQKIGNKRFVIFHTPPGEFAPHMTTKDVNERINGKEQSLLKKYSVYVRSGAKSDLCSPFQLQRIVQKRTEVLREQLLKRFREIEVPSVTKGNSMLSSKVMAVTLEKSGKPATPITITRDRSRSTGVLYHEEISDGIFQEINQVLGANYQLAPSGSKFVFGEPVYYRIYAERQHVDTSKKNMALLLKAGIIDYYAPFLYWLINSDKDSVIQTLIEECKNPKNPKVYSIIRLFKIMGDDYLQILLKHWDVRWGNHLQPPDYYNTTKRFLSGRKFRGSAIHQAITSIGSVVSEISDLDGGKISISDLSGNPERSRQLLSQYSMKVFSGETKFRSECRYLDFLSYGREIQQLAPQLKSELENKL